MLSDALEALSAIEASLVALEANPGDRAAVRDLLRLVHTIKGDASIVQFTGVAEFAHPLEDVLDALDEGELEVDQALISLFLQAVDALRQLLEMAAAGEHGLNADYLELMAQFESLMSAGKKTQAPAPSDEVRAGEPFIERHPPQQPDTLRVDIKKLDELLDLVGEISIFRSRMQQLLDDEHHRVPMAVRDAYRGAEQLYADLQKLVMTVRLVPIGPILRQYTRTIRDLASSLGKQARLDIISDDIEVDNSVLEHLRAPLTHLIRNAVDHGLETAEVRRAQGKPACGCITLRATREAGYILIEVSDDGIGLDRGRLVQRARELGMLSASPVTSEQVDALIFETGLSTRDMVSDISGRGVGMSVVREHILALRGSASVSSEPGVGTTFTLRLPLTLAVIDGFEVKVADESFLVPLDAIVECIALPESERRHDRPYGIVSGDGQPIPYIRLGRVFGFARPRTRREHLLIIRHQNRHIGLCVDELRGERHTVIKPLGRVFRDLSLVVGAAILGSGRVALILDIPALVGDVVRQTLGDDSPDPSASHRTGPNAMLLKQ